MPAQPRSGVGRRRARRPRRVSLVLEIEFLTGVYRAAHSPASNTHDWPPQPDRVFSGLVAAWAVRGEQSIERLALQWLEAQSAPAIHAGDHTVRTTPDVFVPPNDQQATNTERVYLKVMPGWRTRQPRRFPVAHLDDPVMAMVWAADPEPKVLAALEALARDVGYIGHSASLVRCRFLSPRSPAPQHVAAPAARQVYPGRFAELRRAYRLKPARPVILTGAVVLPQPAAPAPAHADWLVLEATGGSVPDIRAAALVARTLRRRLMGGYRGIGMADEIPAAVSGHTPDGRPTRASHLAIAPLAFTGYPHADGRVFGFALIPSAPMVLGDVPGLRAAFEKVAPYDSGAERRVLELRCVPHQPLQLSPAGDSSKRSFMPGAPTLMPAYLDLWVQTSPPPAADPQVDLFLHGTERSSPEVSIVWRSDLTAGDVTVEGADKLEAILELLPPRSAEMIEVPIWAVAAWLRRWNTARAACLADVPERRRSRSRSQRDQPPGVPVGGGRRSAHRSGQRRRPARRRRARGAGAVRRLRRLRLGAGIAAAGSGRG